MISLYKDDDSLNIEFEYYLEVISPEKKGKRIALTESEQIIGRKELYFDGSTSREHLWIKISNGVFFIKDLNAANRTALNGDYITQDKDIAINLGDIIRVGQTRLKFSSEEVSISKVKTAEMPYINKGKDPVNATSEPDKRGLDLNIGADNNAIDKFRNLTQFDGHKSSQASVREVKRVNIDLSNVKPAKKRSKLKMFFYFLLAMGLIVAAVFYWFKLKGQDASSP